MIWLMGGVVLINIIQTIFYYGGSKGPVSTVLFSLLATVSTWCFLEASKRVTSATELFQLGVLYDALILAVWTALPFLMFGATLSLRGVAGLILVLMGTALVWFS
jgi:hypothetical protein